MNRFLACSLMLVAGAAASTTVLADGFKEGQWEITTKMDMPGMPKMPEGMQMPPGMKMPGMGAGYTAKQCLKKDQAAPASQRQDLKCEFTHKDFSGDTFSWASHCTSADGGSVDSEGKATYSGDTMTSQVHMHGTQQGHPMDMTLNGTGKFLGPCPN